MDNSSALALANAHFDAGRLDAAEPIYRKLVAAEPQNAGLLRILGIIARKNELFVQSLAWLERAAALEPLQPLNHFELGTTLIKLDRLERALPCFLQAIELDPKFQSACVNAGAILERLERIDEALPWCLRSVELKPDCSIAWYNLGNVIREQGRIDEAAHCFHKSIELNPDSAKSHWNSAFCHLTRGNFLEGWQEYEWREKAGEVVLDKYREPVWDGSSLAGKTIVVHAEQGIGDEILFASCLPDVIARAGRVIAVCDPRLTAVFSRSFPDAHVVGWQRRKDWTPPPGLGAGIDCQIAAGSVPMFVRSDRESFPNRQHFLLADPALRLAWRRRLAALGPGLKVGISWQAGGQPAERRKRTTSLRQWRDILAVPGVQFINLQYGERASELRDVQQELGVAIHAFADCDPLLDLDVFASLVASLDLVISAGNATVHMAGALGTPAWSLLPLVPSWRWMSDGERSPWYSSVRLFRQQKAGQWDTVFESVTDTLHDLAGSRPTAPRPARKGLGFDAQGQVVIVQSQPQIATDSPFLKAGQGAFSRVAGVPEVFDRAVQHFNCAEFPQAEVLCREILDHTPRHPGALHLLGVVARATRRTDLALRSFRRALAIDGNSPQLYCDLAAAQKDAGLYRESVSSFVRALEIKPDHIDALVHLGNVLRKMEQPQEALRCYLAAIGLDPHVPTPYNAMGAALLDGDAPQEAAVFFQRAIDLAPQDAGAHSNLGRALQLAGRPDDALAALGQAVELDPSCVPALKNLAKLLYSLGQTQQAAAVQTRIQDLRSAEKSAAAAAAPGKPPAPHYPLSESPRPAAMDRDRLAGAAGQRPGTGIANHG